MAAQSIVDEVPPKPRLDRHLRNLAIKVTVVYLIVGALWILGSDALVEAIWSDPHDITVVQTFKGWFFVGASGLMLFLLLAPALRNAGRLSRERAEARRKLNVLADNLPGMVYRCVNDVNWTMEYVSPGSVEVTEYSPEELVGPQAIAFADLVLPEDLPELRRKIDEAVKHSSAYEVAYRVTAKDDTVRWMWERGKAVSAKPGQPAVLEGVIFDETERMELQERLRQSARMKVIGQLSAGAAHDFNNVLSIVRGQAQLGLNEVAIDGPAARRLMGVLHATDRGATLARQLLLFSHREQGGDEIISLGDAMNGLRRLLERTVDDRHQVSFSAGESPGCVRGDRSLLDQVVVNLVINAVDAMPNGGTVFVDVRLETVTKEHSSRLKLLPPPGQYRVIRVRDSGTGIRPELIDRVFEPFFTTKAVGVGSGLGLYSVITSVDRFGGGVEVTSTPDQGTTFEVYLPDCPTAPAVAGEDRRSSAAILVRGSGTVMLVEDSHLVREVAAEYLKDCGYHVTEAVSVSDALQRAEFSPSPIDVAVVDLLLPGMTGERMVELLRIYHPSVRALYVTGYPEEHLRKHGVNVRMADVLTKPLSLEDLGRRVRDLAKPPATMSQRIARMAVR